MSIGERIYKYRKKVCLSQEELADLLNVTRQSISLWETDQSVPSISNMVRLAEIFKISMDELCGNENPQLPPPNESENKSEQHAENNGRVIISQSSIKYDKDVLKDLSKAATGTVITFISSLLVFLGIMLVFVLFIPSLKADSLPVIVCLIILAVLLIALIIANKKKIDAHLKSHPNYRNTVTFFRDCFSVEFISDNATEKYTKQYSEIKKIKCIGDYVFIFFDNKVFPVAKDNLKENVSGISRRLQINPTEITHRKNPHVNGLLLIIFIAALFTPWLALGATSVAAQFSPLPDFILTISEHMWIFLLFIPIPLSSAIIGLVFLTKKYNCKKNIIAGFLLTVFLILFGSFPFMISKRLSHDFGFINYIESELSIDLPDSGYVSCDILGDNYVKTYAMVKFDDEQELLDLISAYEWTNKTPSSDYLPYFYSASLKDYDYYYLFDCDCKKSNLEISGEHTGHDFILIAYSATKRYSVIYLYKI